MMLTTVLFALVAFQDIKPPPSKVPS